MVTGVENTASSGSSRTTSKVSSISSEDFLEIMIKEMQQQDPFQPMSSQDLVNQVSQIRNMQSSMDLSAVLKDLALSQKLSSAGSMIGKMVVGKNSSNENISGLVTSVKREGDKVYLELDNGQRMSVDDVISVNNAPAATSNNNNSSSNDKTVSTSSNTTTTDNEESSN